MFIKQNIPLSGYTTYHIGGLARYFVEIKNGDEAIKALRFAEQYNLPVFFLGGGSNVLISDKGFDGLVIRLRNNEIVLEGDEIEIGAGALLDDVVTMAAQFGLKGLGWAAGIPGTVGGAVRGNAGAFGGEIKDVLRYVKVLKNWNGYFILQPLNSDQCGFSYHSSVFKRNNDLIFSARFKLRSFPSSDPDLGESEVGIGKGAARKEFSANLLKEIKMRRAYRASRHPFEYSNAGSIFKNIFQSEVVESVKSKHPDLETKINEQWFGKIAAGFLIESLGLKGKRIGGAQISDRHANFIINKETAKAEDVVMLMSLAQSKVSGYFNVHLEPEVQLIGF